MLHSIWMHLVQWAIAFGAGGHAPPEGELPPGVTWNSLGPYKYTLEYKGVKHPFNLVDPEESPQSIRKKVMQGYLIFNDPKKYASQYAGDALTCSNCHFSGGNTLGGVNGGLSLVGVTSTYPRYEKRFGKEINIQERIQSCFERSLNGKAPPQNSKEMKALVAYLKWISSEADPLPEKTWLGIKKIPGNLTADPKEGEKDYISKCAACHRPDGEGETGVPPLWGKHSFNDAAGMSQPETFAAFIKKNMPQGQPDLSDQQAVNIAAYVLRQSRPHFKR